MSNQRVGASDNRERYSHRALRVLLNTGPF